MSREDACYPSDARMRTYGCYNRPVRSMKGLFMAQEDPNRLAEWLLVIREYVPTLRRGLADWWEAVTAEPVLLWETPAVRYGGYGGGGLLAVGLVSLTLTIYTPPEPEGARAEATSGDFRVTCFNPECL